MGQCNRCTLEDMERRALGKDYLVETRPAPKAQGAISFPKGVDVFYVRPGSEEHRAWFAELPDMCKCKYSAVD